MTRALMGGATGALNGTRDEVAALHHPVELRLREGRAIRQLLDELSAQRATLVALGNHGHSRAAGIVLGSVVTAMLHEAPCSVLIAHPSGPTDTPGDGQVVLGFDGSHNARHALEVARELAARRSLHLHVIVAAGDPHHSTVPGWRTFLGATAVTEEPEAAVQALVDASVRASLLIIGSRHLRGVLALASVSERVAEQARCPVLVVR